MSVLLCAAAALLAALQDGEPLRPRVECRIEPTQVFAGETVQYEVKALDVNAAGPPDLSGLAIDFVVEALGDQLINTSSTIIFNGARQTRREFGHQYVYRLTPRRTGTLSVPGPLLEADGQTLRGNDCSLEVAAPPPQNVVLLEVSVSRARVYPLQRFTVILDVLVQALPEEFGADTDPLTVLRNPPALQIPWGQVMDGLESGDVNDWIGALQARDGGFSINGYTVGDAFSLFGSVTAQFKPPATWEERPAGGATRRYRRYRIEREFTAQQPGVYRFGPATLKGTFATGYRNERLSGETIYALANTVEVTVAPVPEANRPAGYSGAVGRFSASAELVPAQARVGDPMTLTLRVRGEGLLDEIQPPDLSTLPGLAEVFKSYDATSETHAGERRFTYSLRPLRAGDTEFPSVPLVYFDPEAEAFLTTHTAPIPVSIGAGENVRAGDVIASSGREPRLVTEAQPGYVANRTDLDSLLQPEPAPAAVAGVCGGLLAAFGAAAAGRRVYRRQRADIAQQRRRGAAARARQRLAAARDPEQLAAAFAGLFADRANQVEQGLAAADVVALARAQGVPEATCIRLRQWLDDCDAARFGAGTAGDLGPRGRELLEEVLSSGSSSTPRPVLALLVLALLAPSCRKAADPQLAARFQAAQATFLAAASPAEFLAAAAQFRDLSERHPDSGPLLFNLGNAYAQAGERGRAVAAYRRAQRLLPGDPYLLNNLRLAQGDAPSFDGAQRSLIAQLLFWSRYVSRGQLGWWTLGMASLAFAVALLALFRPRAGLQRARNLAAAVALLCAAAYVILCLQALPNRHGVVIADGTVARKGDSETYEPAFTEPLPQGTEFTLLERRPSWLHARLPGGEEAWIAANSAELY